MIVLDTNVVSEGVKPAPDATAMNWLQAQDTALVFVCGPGLMEHFYGAERYFQKTGSRRYLDYLSQIKGVEFRGRILEFVDPALVVAGRLRADRDGLRRPISIPDAMIAAICLAHGATLATRNVRDFDGLNLKLVNPFEPVG